MARIAVINLGLHGHINATLATVRELVASGESVAYFAPEAFGPEIRATGAEFEAYRSCFSEPVEEFIMDGRSPMPVRLIADALQSLPQLLELVRNYRPDIIAYDQMCLAGRLVAEVLDLPTIRLSSTFVLNDQVPVRTKAMSDPRVQQFTETGIDQICTKYGVKSFQFQDVFTIRADLDIVYTLRRFQPHPETFDERYVFVGPGIDVGPLEKTPSTPSLVYISLGTIPNNKIDFFINCMEALGGDRSKQALIAAGPHAERLMAMPENVTIVKHAPQLQILAEAAAFVSHGGMNSVMESLYFGVPLVLFPQMEEQAINAGRIEELGAGILLREARLSTIRHALERIITERSYRDNAERLGQEVRSSGGFRLAAEKIRAFAKNVSLDMSPDF